MFFYVFGGPEPSKTASEDPRRLPRGYLGLLEAILSHLGAILEIRVFEKAPASWAREWRLPSWLILEPILGPKIGHFLLIWGVFFGASF